MKTDCRDSSPGTSLRAAGRWTIGSTGFRLPGFISRHFIEGILLTGSSQFAPDCRDSSPGTSLRGRADEDPLSRAPRIAGIHLPALH